MNKINFIRIFANHKLCLQTTYVLYIKLLQSLHYQNHQGPPVQGILINCWCVLLSFKIFPMQRVDKNLEPFLKDSFNISSMPMQILIYFFYSNVFSIRLVQTLSLILIHPCTLFTIFSCSVIMLLQIIRSLHSQSNRMTKKSLLQHMYSVWHFFLKQISSWKPKF